MPRRRKLLVALPPHGNRLRSAVEEARVRLGFSQTSLAWEARIGRETLSRIEARRRKGRFMGCQQETALRIAQVLHIPVEELFEWIDQAPEEGDAPPPGGTC